MGRINKQEYMAKVLGLCEEGTTLDSNEYINAHTPILLRCKLGHLRKVTTNSIVSRGSGRTCNECAGRGSNGKKLDTKVREVFKSLGITLLEEYKGANTPISMRVDACGHVNMRVPSKAEKVSAGYCPTCSAARTSYGAKEFAEEISAVDLVPVTPYVRMKENLEVQNKLCGHIYTVNPGHLLYDGIGIHCPVCSGVRNTTRTRFLDKLTEANITITGEYTSTQSPVEVTNNTCGHTYTVIPNNLVSADSGLVCRICHPTSNVSKEESDLVEFVASVYNGWIVTNDRTVLDGLELDIVLPDVNIAIEYNGSYWHNEDRVGEVYHLNKTEQAKAEGYHLIHIFDWEWKNKQNIVKSRIKSALNIYSTKIYARNTEVREIDFPYTFLQENHLQGAGVRTKYNLGLFKDNTLVAVMTFGVPRFSSTYDYELIRFCSLLDTKVVGGASKLLTAFRKKFTGSIISYSDRRWSVGSLYKHLGFTHIRDSKPNYKYIKGSHILSRYQCTKEALKARFPSTWSETKSETQMMTEAGWNKVFDSGNGVWVLNE